MHSFIDKITEKMFSLQRGSSCSGSFLGRDGGESEPAAARFGRVGCDGGSTRGGVQVPAFSSWILGVQRDQATAMKQSRPLRDEREQEGKRRNKKGGRADGAE